MFCSAEMSGSTLAVSDSWSHSAPSACTQGRQKLGWKALRGVPQCVLSCPPCPPQRQRENQHNQQPEGLASHIGWSRVQSGAQSRWRWRECQPRRSAWRSGVADERQARSELGLHCHPRRLPPALLNPPLRSKPRPPPPNHLTSPCTLAYLGPQHVDFNVAAILSHLGHPGKHGLRQGREHQCNATCEA